MPSSVKGRIQSTQDLLLLYFHLWEDVLKLGICLRARCSSKSQPYLANLLEAEKTTIPFISLYKFPHRLLSGILASCEINFHIGKSAPNSKKS